MTSNTIRYPKAIQAGDKIGITAPSAGVPLDLHPRPDLVLGHLRSQGFVVVEGDCLRKTHKHVSAPKATRAAEFVRLWKDPEVRAIMPPWGGELLVELLPLINFQEFTLHEPKWISGFSDLSTLLFSLTLNAGIATLHASNLMDLSPKQTDPLTTGLLRTFSYNAGDSFVQHSSTKYQKTWSDFKTDVDAPLNLTENTAWKILNSSLATAPTFSGRLIGGCLDTIARLVGTPFGDLPRFKKRYEADGAIFYFENCELSPCELARTLWNLRLAGWFDNLNGILIGRSSGPDATSTKLLTYQEALNSVLGDLQCPIIYDMDIGHRPPNLNLINGAIATVDFANYKGKIAQTLR